MSAPEQHEPVEQRSSVEIKQTAKGEPQVRVKVYVGDNGAQLDAARTLAVKAYRDTLADVGAAA